MLRKNIGWPRWPISVFALLWVVACTSGGIAPGAPTKEVVDPAATGATGNVAIRASISPADVSVTSVSVEATPASVTQLLTHDIAEGTYVGTLSLPVGVQRLTVSAYSEETRVASGRAMVTIFDGDTVTVTIAVVIRDDGVIPPQVSDPGTGRELLLDKAAVLDLSKNSAVIVISE